MASGIERPTYTICRCAQKFRCLCLIPRKRKPHPPFNHAAKRGVDIGMHPSFLSGNAESPFGIYDPAPLKPRNTPVDWRREVESEEFSATMGRRYIEKYAIQRDLMKRGRGPGTHEISRWPETITQRKCKNIKEDIGLGGSVPLFEPSFRSTVPGPGYTRQNPYHYIDKRRRDGSSRLPTFEYSGRQRFRTVTKSWLLPCNLYGVKDPNSIAAVAGRSTGKRGPYDLFTGPRDETTIKSYFAKARLNDSDWPKSLPSELDRLSHKSHYFKGRWTTCPRFPKSPGLRMILKDLALCYKDPKEPGPGHYEPKSPMKVTSTKKYPFDINVEFIRPSPPSEIRPGPGRYNIGIKNSIPGNGWTCVFKSKAPRTKFIMIPKYNAF